MIGQTFNDLKASVTSEHSDAEAIVGPMRNQVKDLKQLIENLQGEKLQTEADRVERVVSIAQMRNVMKETQSQYDACIAKKNDLIAKLAGCKNTLQILNNNIASVRVQNEQRQVIAVEESKELKPCQTEVQKLQLIIAEHEKSCGGSIIFETCKEVQAQNPGANNGVYTLYIGRITKQSLYCNMQIGGGMVFARRAVGQLSFDRGIYDYSNGFGDPSQIEYFLGLEKLYRLTTKYNQLRIIMKVRKTQATYTAIYNGFRVGPASSNYQLTVGAYQVGGSNAPDQLSMYNGRGFSTTDRKVDSNPTSCAAAYRGAFWHATCQDIAHNPINVFGLWATPAPTGMYWSGLGELDYLEMSVQ
jgi:ficolin